MTRHRTGHRFITLITVSSLLTILLLWASVMNTAHAQKTAPTVKTNASDHTATTNQVIENWQYRIAPPAPWVQTLELEQIPEPSGDALQILLFDRQIRLDAQGRLTRYIHIRQRINNSAALDEAGRLKISVQPSYEQLDLHGFTLIRDGEASALLDDDKLEILHQEEQLNSSIYTGSLSVLQVIEGLRIGDIVEYRFSIHGRNPVLGEHYSDSWSLGWDVDVARARLRLILPDDRQFVINSDPALAAPSEQHRNGEQRYTWDIVNYDGQTRPADIPPWHFAYPLVEISEYQSWNEVARWGHGLYQPVLDQAVSWPQAVTIIRDPDLTAKDKTIRLLNLVQQEIRYFGIETGINALRPSPSTETIQRRYGDCKDKSVVLTQLLQQAGVQAQTVLVSARHRRGIQDRLPGPHVFDHAIVQATVDGTTYWLDPTATHQAQRLDSLGFIDYGYVLPLQNSAQNLVKVEAPNLPKDAHDLHQTFTTTESGIDLNIAWSRFGRSAEFMRGDIDRIGSDEWNNAIDNFYGRLYAGLSANKQTIHHDDPATNTYTTQHHYAITQPLKLVGTHWRLETYADTIQDYIKLPAIVSRTDPLYWYHPIHIEQTIEVNHESGLPEHAYEPVVIDSKAFSYHRSVTEDDERIVIRHEYTSRMDEIAVADLDQHFNQLRQANEALSLYVFLNSPEEARLNQRNDSLKNKLRNMLRQH